MADPKVAKRAEQLVDEMAVLMVVMTVELKDANSVDWWVGMWVERKAGKKVY